MWAHDTFARSMSFLILHVRVPQNKGTIRQFSWGDYPGLQIANLAAAAATIGSTCSKEAMTVAPGQLSRVTGAHASMRPSAYVSLNRTIAGRVVLGEGECSSTTSTGFVLVLPGPSGSADVGQLPPVLCVTASCSLGSSPNATGSPAEGGSVGTCDHDHDHDHDHTDVGVAVALSVFGTALIGGLGVHYMRSRTPTAK